MTRGRRSQALNTIQIARLESFRRAAHADRPHGYSHTELFQALQPMPFKFDTMMRALAGKPIQERSHAAIAAWIDAHAPAEHSEPVIDSKSRAAGEHERTDDNGR